MEKILILADSFNAWRKCQKARVSVNIADNVELAKEKLEVETGLKVSSSQLFCFLCDQYLKEKTVPRSGKYSIGDIAGLKCEYTPYEYSENNPNSFTETGEFIIDNDEINPAELIIESDE